MDQVNDLLSYFYSLILRIPNATATFMSGISYYSGFFIIRILIIIVCIIIIYHGVLLLIGLFSPPLRHSIHNWVTNILPEYLFSIRLTYGFISLLSTIYDEISNLIIGACNGISLLIQLIAKGLLIPINWLSSKLLTLTTAVSRTLDEIQTAHEKARAEEEERRYNEEKKQAEYRDRRRTLKRKARIERAKRTANAGREYQPPST